MHFWSGVLGALFPTIKPVFANSVSYWRIPYTRQVLNFRGSIRGKKLLVAYENAERNKPRQIKKGNRRMKTI